VFVTAGMINGKNNTAKTISSSCNKKFICCCLTAQNFLILVVTALDEIFSLMLTTIFFKKSPLVTGQPRVRYFKQQIFI
jgi:hypothetical protein